MFKNYIIKNSLKIKNSKLKIPIYIIFLVYLFIFPTITFADSSYVLPYPSAMPGSFFYKLNLLQEEILKYWYFGDFGKFHYSLKQSDKYLVEAKTLFDYKQYLLGHKALKKSDEYFKGIQYSLKSAYKNKKNIADKLSIKSEASMKHIEELEKMKISLPFEFIWSPEKQKPEELKLHSAIAESISIRRQ